MEKKTIGGFIAALRKANGMTQRELAEKLNVSDKAVSRWERDECAPDLTLIPVLADIFGVTTDEILRGERKSEEDSNPIYQKEKSKKQMKNLFEKALLKFKDKSWISIGIAICGYLLVLLFNFAVTIPFAMTGRAGFVFFSWLGITLVCAVLAFVVWTIVYMLFVKPWLVKKTYIVYEEKAKMKMFAVNRLLKHTLVISLAVAIALLAPIFVLQEAMIAFAKKEVFYDYESFGEYMARKEPAWFYEEMEADGSIEYYEPHKNYIFNQYDDSVYEYERWNQNVWLIEYERDEDCLPIFVITNEAYGKVSDVVGYICFALVVLIVADFLAALIIFFKKMRKILKEIS